MTDTSIEKPVLDEWSHKTRQHLHEAGESYLQHLAFAAQLSGQLLLTALMLISHGIFPFIFTTAASGRIEFMYRVIRSRIGKPRADSLDHDWQI